MSKVYSQPPRFFSKLLRWFCKPAYHPDIEGDLIEQFNESVNNHGLPIANRVFIKEVIKLFRPGIIRPIPGTQKLNHIDMLQHTLLITFRNFKKYKSSFFINLIGLSSGLACTLLIYLWVNDELSVDKFYDNDDRLYQVMENRVQSQGIWTAESNSPPMAGELKADFPEIAEITVATYTQNGMVSVDDNNLRSTFKYVDSNFFKVFSHRLISGDKDQVLADKKSVVISEDLSFKLFNTIENVVGKSITLDHDKEFIVSGIFETIPSNASLQFEFLVSTEVIKNPDRNWHWNTTWIRTYLLLQPGTDVTLFNAKIKDFVKIKTNQENSYRTLFVTPYSDRYLYGNYENGIQSGGRIEYVRLFSIIAIFILFIACINFTNLSTARASRRTKEIGIKKAVGANKAQLVFQYLGESVILSYLSLLLATAIVWYFLPSFNEITSKQLSFDIGLFGWQWMSIGLFTGLFAGIYPAFYLSGFSAVAVLKGTLHTTFGELWTRRGLVIFQFVLAIVLITSVIVVYQQVEMVQSRNLGYDNDHIIVVPREGKLNNPEQLETILTEIRNIPGVISASSSSHRFAGHSRGTSGVVWAGRDPEDRTEFELVEVNYGLIETLDIKIKEGRSFSRSLGADSSKLIFSEEASKCMGMENPIGKTVKLWGDEMQIIGVSNDFHYQSLHTELKPLFFRLAPDNNSLFMVKIEAQNESTTIARISGFCENFNPGFPFEYQYLDQTYQSLYRSEQRVAILSKYFAGLAILISCLGLFGLAAFTAERRTKEIGIRKILGSGVFRIVYLLSSDFSKMVLVAMLIACPISYFMAKNWLANFAYRIDLEWWLFAASGLLALLIAWLVVGWETLKVARVNPSECLRGE